MKSGCFARRAARSASLTRSILLRSRRDGTTSAPISRSALRLTLKLQFVRRIGRVDDEQQQRRFERLGERRSEQARRDRAAAS